ncbi:MAG: sugar phosphate isomerase/epimerase [Planctomycetota bacterium]
MRKVNGLEMERREFMALGGAAAASLALPGCNEMKPVNQIVPETSVYLETIGLQLWTVRNQLEEDPRKTMEAISEAGYKQVELMDVMNQASEIVPIASELFMGVNSAFLNWQTLANPGEGVPTIDEIISEAVDWRLNHLVFGYIGKGHRETADHYKRHIEAANEAGAKAKEAGIQLCYHNHSFEFQPLDDGKCGFDMMVEGFDHELVKFEIDVFWVQVGGRDPIEVMKQLGSRVAQVHLKDLQEGTGTIYDEGEVPHEAFKEVGAGVIDMEQVLQVAEDNGVSFCHVEQDQSPDPLASISQSIDHLNDDAAAEAGEESDG